MFEYPQAQKSPTVWRPTEPGIGVSGSNLPKLIDHYRILYASTDERSARSPETRRYHEAARCQRFVRGVWGPLGVPYPYRTLRRRLRGL